MPSPEQDEEKAPYPPAKKGDKPGALVQMLRDIFLAGGLQVGSCQFLLLGFSWRKQDPGRGSLPKQGTAKEGRGQVQHQKLLLSPRHCHLH